MTRTGRCSGRSRGMPSGLSAVVLGISLMILPATGSSNASTPVVPDTISAKPSPPDSLRAAGKDTTSKLASSDTTGERADSLERMSTPSLVGTIDRWLDSSAVVARNEIPWMEYRSLADIVRQSPGFYLRDQGSPGQYDGLAAHGTDWRSMAVLQNGRLLNDPASGIFRLSEASPEYADRVEIVSGSRAFLYGFNSTGATINLVTKNYNSNRPFTKIDYAEASYGFGYSDGTFSQNLSRKFNLTFGYQHVGTDGRYLNSDADNWNVRGKIRYSPVRSLNIIFSEIYTSTFTGLNGGLNMEKTGTEAAFNPKLAVVRNADAYEKLTRNDVDLSLVGTFFGDTVNVTTLTLYYSHLLREYRDEENRNLAAPNGVFIQSDHVSSWMGALFSQNLDAEFTRLTVGGSIELRQIEGSPNLGRHRDVISAAYGKDDILLGDRVVISGYGRVENYIGSNAVGFGADASISVLPALRLFGGGSSSRRWPNYEEQFWTDSTVSRPSPLTPERHLYFEAGAEITLPRSSTIRLAAFHRIIQNPIVLTPLAGAFVFPGITFSNGSEITTSGIETTFGIRFWYLFVEGQVTALVRNSGGTRLDDQPQLYGSGGLYFWDKLLNNNLELKAGVRGTFYTAHQGEAFNPEILAYVPNTGDRLGAASSLDLIILAHIGDAYVHLAWQNLTNVKYFTTPYYVAEDRVLRFGLSWEFLD
jgi:outer membrane cobalamin receptor